MSVEDGIPASLNPMAPRMPRDHIKFEFDEVIGLTALGKKTIEVLRLDSKFQEARLRHFAIVRQARDRYINLMNSVDPKAREDALHSRRFVERTQRSLTSPIVLWLPLILRLTLCQTLRPIRAWVSAKPRQKVSPQDSGILNLGRRHST